MSREHPIDLTGEQVDAAVEKFIQSGPHARAPQKPLAGYRGEHHETQAADQSKSPAFENPTVGKRSAPKDLDISDSDSDSTPRSVAIKKQKAWRHNSDTANRVHDVTEEASGPRNGRITGKVRCISP